VIELGIILYLLMGWQFAAAEWLGAALMAAIMALLVRATYPRRWAEAARRHEEKGGHSHEPSHEGPARLRIARNFVMEWSMMWKDMAAGFLIAGFLAAFVPAGLWPHLFPGGAADAVIGPLVAVITFVCSIGNVPMAAVLWSSGVGFGGVLAFLYGDLIVLPLLDVYRRQYGRKMAAYIGIVLYASMVLAAIAADASFDALGWVPGRGGDVRSQIGHFAFDYTFWLNLAFGGLAAWLAVTARLGSSQEPNVAAKG
jgi:hypothetical protein